VFAYGFLAIVYYYTISQQLNRINGLNCPVFPPSFDKPGEPPPPGLYFLTHFHSAPNIHKFDQSWQLIYDGR
jgi:hypothetical protein